MWFVVGDVHNNMTGLYFIKTWIYVIIKNTKQLVNYFRQKKKGAVSAYPEGNGVGTACMYLYVLQSPKCGNTKQ